MKKQIFKISLLTIASFLCFNLYANHHEKAYKFETIFNVVYCTLNSSRVLINLVNSFVLRPSIIT